MSFLKSVDLNSVLGSCEGDFNALTISICVYSPTVAAKFLSFSSFEICLGSLIKSEMSTLSDLLQFSKTS